MCLFKQGLCVGFGLICNVDGNACSSNILCLFWDVFPMLLGITVKRGVVLVLGWFCGAVENRS